MCQIASKNGLASFPGGARGRPQRIKGGLEALSRNIWTPVKTFPPEQIFRFYGVILVPGGTHISK